MRPDKFIFLNGPPGVGKDTAYLELEKSFKQRTSHPYGVQLVRFSFPIKYAVLAYLGVFSLDHPLAIELEANKDKPHHLLRGKTYRQAQIGLSELHVKPFYGADQYGQWMVHHIKQQQLFERSFKHSWPILFICPDSGFIHEAEPVIKYLGEDNCLLIKMHRDGKDYSNDSRSHLNLPGITTRNVYNDSTETDLRHILTEIVEGWLAQTET